jgi:glycosyltransferase involved in cell wall biosynthesis
MRVLILGWLFRQGGIQTHTHYLAQGLVERGHDVTVTSPRRNAGPVEHPRYTGDYRFVVYKNARSALMGLGTSRKSQFDIVVVCGTGWAAMLGALATKARKRVFFEVMSGKRHGYFDPRMLVHAGFDALVGQAEPVEIRFCCEFGWKKLRATIAALPEPLERTARIPTRSDTAARGNKRLKLAYFGRLAKHKGVDYLVQKWDRLARYAECLDVYGTGPEEDQLRALLQARGLDGVVNLKGKYPTGQEYVDLLQQYDLELLPTIGDEGAPLVLLEAMACGLPFVANGVGGISAYSNPDVGITNGDRTHFLDLCDEFAEKLRSGVISGARLQRFYADRFGYDVLIDRWEKFLGEVANEG